MARVTKLDQTFVNEPISRLTVQTIRENELTSDVLDAFFASSPPSQSIGLSPAYSSGNLNTLAIAVTPSVLLVQFSSKKKDRDAAKAGSGSQARTGRKLLEERVLCRPYGNVVAFDLAPLALILYSDHGLRLNNGVDIQSCCYPKDRIPLFSIKQAAADIELFEDNVISAFRSLEFDQNDQNNTRELALRAWVSHYITQLAGMEERFEKAVKVNTMAFSDTVSVPFSIYLARIVNGNCHSGNGDSWSVCAEWTSAGHEEAATSRPQCNDCLEQKGIEDASLFNPVPEQDEETWGGSSGARFLSLILQLIQRLAYGSMSECTFRAPTALTL